MHPTLSHIFSVPLSFILGSYSLGGGIRFDEFTHLPTGFTIENFDATEDRILETSTAEAGGDCPAELVSAHFLADVMGYSLQIRFIRFESAVFSFISFSPWEFDLKNRKTVRKCNLKNYKLLKIFCIKLACRCLEQSKKKRVKNW